MMRMGFGAFLIHQPGIPFVEIGWHGIHAPVDEQAELRLRIPLWDAVVGEAFPVIFKRALFDHFVDRLQVCLHFCGIAQKYTRSFNAFFYVNGKKGESQLGEKI